MMAGTMFNFEVIYNSIKDSQYEKTRNEKRLSEAKQSRINLERKYEAVASKHAQLNEIHNKMLETLKVGQHKVMQTQSQIDSQETINSEIREKLNKLENLIEEEEKKHQSQREDYEDKLSELERLYREANQFYKDDALLKQVSEILKQKNIMSEKLEASDADKGDLRMLLEGLQLKEDVQEKQQDVDEEQQKILQDMFQADLESKKATLATLQKTRIKIEKEVKQLSEWEPPSEFVLEEDPSLVA
ncbi:CAP-Gly domain-containing linker protein 1-like [Anneissia japonica]|uniref:CAP-Gly domain-containing linker protein 1-like n=1 Tax=Anneissia japonica TaxID=1529436 RepID=UPI0014255E71|nr:CAP-Gly domain-containing linker protein 1-like [Anneissia japonica]